MVQGGNSPAKGIEAGKPKMPVGVGWAVEVTVLILLVVTAVIVIGEVLIIQTREAMPWSSSEPGRQPWTWDGCPRHGESLVGL